MNNLRKFSEKPFFLPIIALIVGMVIGLVVLGWGIWPVQWVDAAPSQMQNEYKRDYLCMVIDSYVRNHDEDLVNKRLASLGDDVEDYVNMLTPALCKFTSQEEIDNFKALKFTASAGAIDEKNLDEQAAVLNDEQTDEPAKTSALTVILYVVGIALVGGAAYMILLKRGKLNFKLNTPQKPKRVVKSDGFAEDTVQSDGKTDQYAEPPLAQFMTTFRLGDDLYDDSFSIDSPSGEFLGECGVGIAETIGVGDPKKVNALEVWLFDKNDIQTITKVLMSEHSFNDPDTRQRLAAKGETILVETGQRFVMETATLQLQARVVDMVYARDAMPENSHFSRLTLEISVLNKM